VKIYYPETLYSFAFSFFLWRNSNISLVQRQIVLSSEDNIRIIRILISVTLLSVYLLYPTTEPFIVAVMSVSCVCFVWWNHNPEPHVTGLAGTPMCVDLFGSVLTRTFFLAAPEYISRCLNYCNWYIPKEISLLFQGGCVHIMLSVILL
jgi:hypothetical protein